MKSHALLKLIMMTLLLQTVAMPSRAAHECQSIDMTSPTSPMSTKKTTSAHAAHMAMQVELPSDYTPPKNCHCNDCNCASGQCHSSTFLMSIVQVRTLVLAPTHRLSQHNYVVLTSLVTPHLRPPIIS